MPDPYWGETVTAVVVTQTKNCISREEIIAYCKENLASYKCPDNIIFHTELPYNMTGKVDRKILRAEIEALQLHNLPA